MGGGQLFPLNAFAVVSAGGVRTGGACRMKVSMDFCASAYLGL